MKGIAAAFAALLLVALPAPARAEVDFFVGASADVLGSIRPAGDKDVLRFVAPAGSRVSIVARALTGDLALDLALADALDADVPFAATAKGRSLRALRVPLATSGVYSLTVSGTGAGEYRLAIRVLPQRRVSITQTIDPGFVNRRTFEFAGLTGSSARVRLRIPTGSPALPCVDSADNSCVGDPGPTPRFRDRASLGPHMSIRYEVSNVADLAGDVTMIATIRPQSLVPKLWDLRAASRGFPDGGETAIAVSWRLTENTRVAVETGPLAGTNIRANGINTADVVAILGVTSSPDPTAEQLEGMVRIGPTVRFVSNVQRPSYDWYVYRNGNPVVPPPNYAVHASSFEIPYDPALLPVGATETSSVSVLRIGLSGRASLVNREFMLVDTPFNNVLLFGPDLDPFARYCVVASAN